MANKEVDGTLWKAACWCGCRIVGDGSLANVLRIARCPLHAAAPKLAKALDNILAAMRASGTMEAILAGNPSMSHLAYLQMQKEARVALAKARGGEA